MTPLALALTLVCAWSQPHCQALQARDIVVADVHGSMTAFTPTGIQTFILPALAGTDLRTGRVSVSSQLTHPVAMGAVLAHEATEILEGPPPNGKDCDGYEGWPGQQAFYAWFVATFGPPEAVPGSQDWVVFRISVPGQQPPRPC